MENNVSNLRLSKEAIASRMFRNAARMWGYNDTDLDNFDPLVRLLVEACAVEVYNINNEINNVQQRMLERLSRLLTPEVNTSARPSHAILHGKSLEPISNVYPSVQFFHHKKIASKLNGPLDSNIDLFFSPTANYKIFDGDVKFIACGSNVYAVNDTQTKESFIRSENKLPAYTAWVAVELNNRVESLEGLSFFIDFKNLSEKDSLLDLLPYSKWNFNNNSLQMAQGIWEAVNNQIASDTLYGIDEFKLTPNVEQGVYQFYKKHFITIEHSTIPHEAIHNGRSKYPAEFEKVFEAHELNTFQNNLCWFKINFPANFDEQILDELSVSINCYPVMNRHLNEVRYRLQSHFNIIPLITNEQFLDIKSVQNISGKTYVANPIEKDDLSEKGTYAVRSSGVERFDSRNANEHLNYLTELLRDESNAFAAYGQDFISSLIRELKQNISQIEQKVQQNSVAISQRSTFLFLKPFEENENIFVEFWSTNGELSNLIRSGTKLDLYSGSDIHRESLVLMTTTIGGKDKLRNTELVAAYKNTLLSRGRIVTQQDIKNACQQVFGSKMQKAEVKKGIAMSTKPDEGLINTVDVTVATNKQLNEEELQALQHELLIKLQQGSVVMTNYRVFLN